MHPSLPFLKENHNFRNVPSPRMGDWCSEGCNRNQKEISTKVKMAVPRYSGFTRKAIFLRRRSFSS
jgi:hypothetical protein